MKLGKSIIIGVAVLVPVISIIVWLLFSNLNTIVAQVIQDAGRNVVQTEVKVNSVDVDLANGKAVISSMTIANPDGYLQPYIFAMDDIVVAIDVQSLRTAPIIINEILVRQPKVNFELDKTGKSNLSVLKENINQSSKPVSEKGIEGKNDQQGESEVSNQTRVIIKKLSFERGQLNVYTQIKADEKIEVELPLIHLQNLGQTKGGATGNEIAVEMMTQLVAQIAEEAVKARFKDAFNKKTQNLKDAFNKGTQNLKDAFDKEKQNIEDTFDEEEQNIEDTFDKAAETIKGLFE